MSRENSNTAQKRAKELESKLQSKEQDAAECVAVSNLQDHEGERAPELPNLHIAFRKRQEGACILGSLFPLLTPMHRTPKNKLPSFKDMLFALTKLANSIFSQHPEKAWAHSKMTHLGIFRQIP